jgi:hypothetical protein
MASVDIRSNPTIVATGTKDSEVTTITSDIDSGDLVMYQIEKIATGTIININSNADVTNEGGVRCGNITAVDKVHLSIILEPRTKYRVRTKAQYGAWGAWVNFKTRDKRYQSPDSITQLSDDSDSTAQTQGFKIPSSGNAIQMGGNRTIVVTNSGKATEVDNSAAAYGQPRNWGAVTVTNNDTIYNEGQLQATGVVDGVHVHHPIAYTDRGATVINIPEGKNNPIKYTARGATIYTKLDNHA